MMQVIVDSLLTQYQLSGKGKLVVLLHGWGDDNRTFDGLRTHLARHYQVVSLDLPGFGGSQAPNVAWGLADYAKFVTSFLTKINAPNSYALVAHSNGGAVAIYGLAHHQLEAQKLVLLGAAGIRNRQKAKKLLVKLVAKGGKAATIWLPRRHRRHLQNKLYGVAGSDMLVVPQLRETFKRTVSQDVQTEARKLDLPTLLIYGQQDRATPPLYGEIYHGLIDGSKLEVIGSAGHFVHHDQPDQTNRLVAEFLK